MTPAGAKGDDMTNDGHAGAALEDGQEPTKTDPTGAELTGSGVSDADGGSGTYDSRLGGGGAVGADIGGQGGTGASGNALEGEGPTGEDQKR